MSKLIGLSSLTLIAPGLGTAQALSAWVNAPVSVPTGDLVFEKKLPMMVARRMAQGSRLAAEVAVSILEKEAIDAIIFTSRHGETPRGEKLLSLIANQSELSPTDFMMSVHNAAVGMVTIAKKLNLPTSSVASGADSFHAGVVEALGMLSDGLERVLVVDFENVLPPMIGAGFGEVPDLPYALGVVVSNDGNWIVDMDWSGDARVEPSVPQGLAFAHGVLRGKAFEAQGAMSRFTWSPV